MKNIEDLLDQATRECFVRGTRSPQQVSDKKIRIDMSIFTCVKSSWYLITYWAGERREKKEDNCPDKLGPFSFEVKKIHYPEAQETMLQLTEGWRKKVHAIDAIKRPFYFYDEVTNQVMYEQNILVNLHLATLLGMYCVGGYCRIPYGEYLFNRLQGLQSRCINEMQKVFTV